MTDRQLAELGASYDEEGHIQGFQVGRAAALLDWEHKREAREFDRLCARLRARNWARQKRATSPEAVREQQRRWRAANPERARELGREQKRRTRLAKAKTCTCEQCGGTWLPVSGRRPGRFCSKKCRNRWWGKHRVSRNRGIRSMNIGARIRTQILQAPWSTPAEVATATGLKAGSVATLLCIWGKEGRVDRIRHGRGYRYAFAEVDGSTRESAA